MYSAIADEPTKPIARTRGSVSSVSTASLLPLTTLSTPAGSPAATSNSASRIGTDGSRSDGLRMKALPQASAGANFHIGIMAGKLNGVMPATTPSGWRIENKSMPGPALSLNSPLSRCGMPHANSTTSSPRWISPLESAMVLPCSEDKSWARLSNSFCTSSRNLNRTRARRCGLVVAQAGCAASALAMACSTSDFLAKLTLACTSPVLGLNTSPLRPDVPATFLPPMKWPISRMRASLRTLGSRWRALFPVSDSAACPAREAGEVDHKWISRQLRQSAGMSHQASASLASLVGVVDGRKKLHAELHVVPSFVRSACVEVSACDDLGCRAL